jgi:hypothetical protein
MTDSKNIVIKVKYTAPDAGAESSASARIVTEWNIKRIVGAVGIAILLLVALYFLLSGKFDPADTARNETASNKAPISKPSVIKAEPRVAPPSTNPGSFPEAAKEPLIPSHSSSSAPPAKPGHRGRVRRAALAYRIIDKEPTELIGTTVSIGNGKPVLVHYFTEVRGKATQILFHEWINNGQTIQRNPMEISAERWRTSSKRQLSQKDLGHWSVRTVDDKGDIMNEIHFTVSAK